MSQLSREANFTGVIRAPSAEVTATPSLGSGATLASSSRVSRQNRRKSPRRVIGGRVSRAAVAATANAGIVES